MILEDIRDWLVGKNVAWGGFGVAVVAEAADEAWALPPRLHEARLSVPSGRSTRCVHPRSHYQSYQFGADGHGRAGTWAQVDGALGLWLTARIQYKLQARSETFLLQH
jgi:hypothetical protein